MVFGIITDFFSDDPQISRCFRRRAADSELIMCRVCDTTRFHLGVSLNPQ